MRQHFVVPGDTEVHVGLAIMSSLDLTPADQVPRKVGEITEVEAVEKDGKKFLKCEAVITDAHYIALLEAMEREMKKQVSIGGQVVKPVKRLYVPPHIVPRKPKGDK